VYGNLLSLTLVSQGVCCFVAIGDIALMKKYIIWVQAVMVLMHWFCLAAIFPQPLVQLVFYYMPVMNKRFFADADFCDNYCLNRCTRVYNLLPAQTNGN
jgi:hypothetical protein